MTRTLTLDHLCVAHLVRDKQVLVTYKGQPYKVMRSGEMKLIAGPGHDADTDRGWLWTLYNLTALKSKIMAHCNGELA